MLCGSLARLTKRPNGGALEEPPRRAGVVVPEGHFSLKGDMALQLTSPVCEQGGEIPKRYTCDGDDVSPPLRGRGTPDGTQSIVLLCNDPGAPGGTFRHWAAYDIPGDWVELAEGHGAAKVGDGFRQAINEFGKPGYAGPARPGAMARATILSA